MAMPASSTTARSTFPASVATPRACSSSPEGAGNIYVGTSGSIDVAGYESAYGIHAYTTYYAG
jgi:hypothetical protein